MARVTDTKERLLEATLELIWEESLGAASVDAICEKAEVRKGSFYHFFKSKEELVAAALEAHFKTARVDFDRIFDYIEGAMTAGRIQNSMSPIQKMGRNAFKLLGLEWEAAPTSATKS